MPYIALKMDAFLLVLVCVIKTKTSLCNLKTNENTQNKTNKSLKNLQICQFSSARPQQENGKIPLKKCQS